MAASPATVGASRNPAATLLIGVAVVAVIATVAPLRLAPAARPGARRRQQRGLGDRNAGGRVLGCAFAAGAGCERADPAPPQPRRRPPSARRQRDRSWPTRRCSRRLRRAPGPPSSSERQSTRRPRPRRRSITRPMPRRAPPTAVPGRARDDRWRARLQAPRPHRRDPRDRGASRRRPRARTTPQCPSRPRRAHRRSARSAVIFCKRLRSSRSPPPRRPTSRGSVDEGAAFRASRRGRLRRPGRRGPRRCLRDARAPGDERRRDAVRAGRRASDRWPRRPGPEGTGVPGQARQAHRRPRSDARCDHRPADRGDVAPRDAGERAADDHSPAVRAAAVPVGQPEQGAIAPDRDDDPRRRRRHGEEARAADPARPHRPEDRHRRRAGVGAGARRRPRPHAARRTTATARCW